MSDVITDSGRALDRISPFVLKAIEVERGPFALTLRPINPNLGRAECPAILEAAVEVLADIGPRTRLLVLDLSHVTRFTALGIGLCQDLAKRAAERKLRPVLFGLDRGLVDQLRVFGIDKQYELVLSRAQLHALMAA